MVDFPWLYESVVYQKGSPHLPSRILSLQCLKVGIHVIMYFSWIFLESCSLIWSKTLFPLPVNADGFNSWHSHVLLVKIFFNDHMSQPFTRLIFKNSQSFFVPLTASTLHTCRKAVRSVYPRFCLFSMKTFLLHVDITLFVRKRRPHYLLIKEPWLSGKI